MRKDIRIYIERELSDFHITLKEIEQVDDLREDILNESPPPPDGLPRGGEVSDPTLNRFVKLDKLTTCRRMNQMHKTVYAIKGVVDELPPEKLKLVQLKYWTRPQTLTDTGIALKLNCHPNTFYLWRNGICEAIARNLGLI